MSLNTGISQGLRQGLVRGLNSVNGRETITLETVTASSSTTDGTTVATASITLLPNILHTLWVASAVGAGTANAATCTGWTQIGSIAQGIRTLTALRYVGGAESTGALTIAFGGQTQTSFCWVVARARKTKTGGVNGADGIRQAVTGNGAASPVTNTLAALEHPNNMHVCGIQVASTLGVTPDADFAELSDVPVSTSNISLEVQYAINQAPCTSTWTSSAYSVLSVELVAL